MKKRFYMMLLALAMITTLAVPAFAADTPVLKVGGVAVTESNKDDVLGDGKVTVTFDGSGNPTVALNGAAIDNAAGPGIEYTGTGTLTVKISGSGNTITGTDGIKSSGSISLNVGWDSITGTNGAGISAENDIVIDGTDKVGGTITGTGCGIYAGEDITIKCKMGAVTGTDYGVFAGGDITIESVADVSSITAQLGNGINAGTYGDITITGKVGSITAAQKRCISAKNVTISGEVGDITGSTYGIYAGNSVSITGKVGNIKVEREDDNYSYGIYAGVNVAISGEVGDITVTAAAAGAYGIYAKTDIEINNTEDNKQALGNVTATAAEGKKAYGLYAGGGGNLFAVWLKSGKIGAITGGIEAVGNVQLAGTIAGKIDSINASGGIIFGCDLTDGVEIGKIVSHGGEIVITRIVGNGNNKIGEIISETDIVAIAGDVYSAIGLIKGQKDVGILAAGTITGTGTGNVTGNIGSISAPDGDVIISGKVTGNIGGISAPDGDVIISGKVTGNIGGITAGADVIISGKVTGDISGITAGGNVEIKSTAAVGRIKSTTGHGIYAGGYVTITGTVGDIQGGTNGYGISATGKITLGAKDDGDPSTPVSVTVIGTITGGGSYGIYGKTVEINMDLIHVSGIYSETDLTLSKQINSIGNSAGYGIYSGGNITISGTIGFQGATGPVLSGSLGGIYAVGNIDITGTVGEVTATAGYGISATGDVTISGTVGDVKATNNGGIYANGKIDITGTVGDITAKGYGIYAQSAQTGSVKISGTVDSITITDNGVGVNAAGSIKITGTVGKITAPGDDGWGIMANGAVQIAAGGTVAGIDAGSIGIYSSSGTTIDGQLGPVKAGSTGISAGSVTITGQVIGIQATSNRGISASGKITITGTVGNITGGAAGHGISAGDSGIDLGDSGSTTVIGNISGGDSGLYTTGMIQLDGDLTVGNITGTSGYGIYAGSNMQPVTNTIQVGNVTGKEGGISGNADSGAATILGGKWGIIQATGLEGDDHAIYSKTGLVVERGAIIDGIKAAGGDGIHTFAAEGSNLFATFNAMSDSEIVYIDAAGHGIYAGDGINPQGTIGTIKAGKDGIRSEGNNLLISGPVGDITAGEYGIYAGGTSDITITGYKNGTERTDITAGETAIYCEAKPVTIYGDWGNIESTGGHGIYAGGDITISGDVGNISATTGDGIRGGAPGTASGNVTISGTVKSVTGGDTGIIAMGKVTISGTVGSENPAEDFIAIHGTGNDGIYADNDGGGVEISGTIYGDIVGARSGIMAVCTASVYDDISITGSIHGDIKGGAIGILAGGDGTVAIGETADITGNILATGTATFGGDNYGIYGSAVEINADLPGTVGGICSSWELVLSKKIGAIRNEHGHGISAHGGLTVEGTAEIGTIYGTGSGIYSHAGNIEIKSGTTGAVTGGTYGIYANNGNITISGTVPSVTAANGDGIYAVGNITISGKIDAITATGGSGIYADGGAITISGTVGNIDASDYHGITGDTITISRNGAVGNIKVGSDFNGICSWNPSGSAQVIIAGTLGDITGGKIGIYVTGGAGSCITVEDTGVVGDIDVTNSGIQANGDITIAGTVGDVKTSVGQAIIATGDITISGTVNSVTATGTGGYGYGIYANGDITIESDATLGDITANQAGIHATGGAITISGTTGAVTGYRAIGTNNGDITISGTVGDITGTEYGIYAGGSNVTVSGTVGNVTGRSAITASITSSDGPGGAITISGTTGILTADPTKGHAISGGSTVTITDSALIGDIDPESDTVDVVGSIFANEDITIAAPLTVEYSTFVDQAVRAMNGQIILQGVMVKSGALNGPQVELVPGSPVVAIPMYYPAVSPASGGSVKAIPLAVSEGSAVTLLVTPEEGRELVSLTVTDASGRTVPVEQIGENRWRFVQPDSKITVTPVFARAESPMDRYVDLDPDAWYRAGVEFVLEQGLMIGTGADRFSPEDTLDRAQVLTVLWRLEGSPASDSVHYTDVPEHEWYADAVSWASDLGLALGHGNGTFGPEDPLTLEQLAAFLHRFAQLKQGGITETSLSAAMNWAEAQGLLAGMEQVTSPTAPALRTQIAWMLKGLLDQ